MSSQPDLRDRTSDAIDNVSRRVSAFAILMSVALVVCGILAILLPIEMSLGVVIVISWLLMISGVVQLIHAIRSKTSGSRLWAGIIAVIYFSMGLILRLNLGIGIAALTFGLIWFFVAQGAIDVFAYFRKRKAGASGWQLLEGATTLVLGLMIWRHWPSSSLWVIGTLVGINMIITGVTRLMLALAVRSAVKAIEETA